MIIAGILPILFLMPIVRPLLQLLLLSREMDIAHIFQEEMSLFYLTVVTQGLHTFNLNPMDVRKSLLRPTNQTAALSQVIIHHEPCPVRTSLSLESIRLLDNQIR